MTVGRSAPASNPSGKIASPKILGYEARRLVSVDFKDDPRSAIVDAPSIGRRQVRALLTASFSAQGPRAP
jgi:hypothetical protein